VDDEIAYSVARDLGRGRLSSVRRCLHNWGPYPLAVD
jgi:hypothetical protein